MSILDVKFENWNIVSLRINWSAIIAFVILLFLLNKCVNWGLNKLNRKNIQVKEWKLGIGQNTITLKYNKKDQEIAYKLWVELSTRKIGILFDPDNDVIEEVYNSWYEFFAIARELLKEIPASRIPYSYDLIQLTENILNIGLRPHLTEWQAQYRKWYTEAAKGNKKPPQEIQRDFDDYEALVNDLIKTNMQMIEYKDLMHDIAFNFDRSEKSQQSDTPISSPPYAFTR